MSNDEQSLRVSQTLRLSPSPLAPSAQRVQDALHARGLSLRVKEFPASTRTAQEAATAVGCEVGQIVKSLIFKSAGGKAILVVASGANRVDEAAIAQALGEKIGKADADFVREQTGFVIGGVPPVGHLQPLTTFVDEDLAGYEVIWAAAGTPNAVFQLTAADLIGMTNGVVMKVKK